MSAKYDHLKIAIIGCGNWGKNLIRVFHQLGALYAVCDTDPTRATAFSEKYNVHHYSLEQILNSKEIDGVVIATPSFTHYELGFVCLEANKHVFIEKPLAVRVKNAISLNQLAQNQGLILMVGHLLQYHSAFITLKELKQEGILGDLQYIYCHRFSFGKYRTEESVLWDFAPHDISMVLSLIGEMPHQIFATSANHLRHTVTDNTHIHLNFNSNVQAHIFVSWLHPYKEQKLIVVGNKAMAIFDDCQPWDSKLRLYRYPAEWADGLPQPFPSHSESVPLEPMEPLFNECSHFLSSIVRLNTPRTDGNEGINVMTILEAASQSMTIREMVTLPLNTEISKQTDITTSTSAEEAISS